MDTATTTSTTTSTTSSTTTSNTNSTATTNAELTFASFLEKMRKPAASDLVSAIKHFIAAFHTGTPDPARDSRRLQDFLRTTEAAFRAHILWRNASADDLEAAGEALEKYIMTKLYPLTFAVSPDDTRRDAAIARKFQALAFLKPEHLDIPPEHRVEASWLLAQKELCKCDSYKAPRDKLVCALNCCRIISNLLRVAAEQGAPPGADDFFPVLVYVVVRAAPPRIVSNLEFIARFRAENRLVSEAEYFLTNLMSAVHFIETMRSEALTSLSEEEKHVLDSVDDDAETNESANDAVDAAAPAPPAPGANVAALPPAPARLPPAPAATYKTVAQLYNEGEALVVAAEESGELLSAHPFLYYAPEDLLLSDVPRLLAAYKETALKLEALTRAISSGSR